MDKQQKYQKAIIAFLEDYSQIKPSSWKNVQNQVIIDRINNHYQLVRVGWHNGEHIHYAVFHFDLVNDKVLIQENRTDLPVIDELVELGVQKDDIVLAFQEALPV